ncbi:MAG: hypothetical protein E7561_06935 [Ruminococcaceae bacterium]|nr:hypothetical protein [Oscillospiraceae bacterium]
MYTNIKEKLQAFYFSRPAPWGQDPHNPMLDTITDAAEKTNETSAYKLKAIQYKTIAEIFQPKIFACVPFYYELATKNSYGDGSPFQPGKHAGGWLTYRNYHLFRDENPEVFDQFKQQQSKHFHFTCGPYVDLVHYCFSYTNVVKNGLKGIWEQAVSQLPNCKTQKEKEFIECGIEGLLAVKRIAERFAEEAKNQLQSIPNLTQDERDNLEWISRTATRVPWEAPQTFHEVLNCLAFFREVAGSIDGIGQNAFGRPDVLLKPFYDTDLKDGILTKEKAKDLICKFLLLWDCHHDRTSIFSIRQPHEFENSLNIGGCDENGNEIFNEITEMFLDAHYELNCIFPKIMCRYSAKSSKNYLQLINRALLAGKSNITLSNDDSIIPALVKSGKTVQDARNYLTSGCWDITIEGCEKKPCAEYFNLMRPLEAAIHRDCLPENRIPPKSITVSHIETAQNFEELYNMILKDIYAILEYKRNAIYIGYRIWSDICPNPFYSICMKECLENRKDVTAGGAKYNPNTVYFAGFANLVNSLLAWKEVCFDKKQFTLQETIEAMRKDWDGYGDIRQAMMSTPYFGDNTKKSKELSAKLHNDLCNFVNSMKSYYGDTFNAGYLNYVEFKTWGHTLRATPDGRKLGDAISHGIGPTRFRYIESPSTVINSMTALDFTKCPSGSILNMVLPANISSAQLEAVERTMAKAGVQSIHLNCIDKNLLLEAQKHPEEHADLIVRVCGFSAQFVSLEPSWQEEFINRNFYKL